MLLVFIYDGVFSEDNILREGQFLVIDVNEVYCKGTPADKADILDFGNYVFSQSEDGRPHNFKTLIPKIYDDKYDTADWHYICKVDSRIKAMVMLEKSELRVGKHILKIGGIGTVSVHPYSRGSGYMKKLMNSAVADIRSECDLGVLGGQRQRYEYFGFEPAGVALNFTVTATNVRHRYRDINSDNISFIKVSAVDIELLAFVRKLHDTHPLSGVRAGSHGYFFDVMSTWNASLWVISDSGKSIGYICGYPGSINEIMLTDYELLPAVIKGFITKLSNGSCSFAVSPVERELIKELAILSEGCRVSNNHSFLLANPEKVITAFLELKASYAPLQNGSTIIKIGEKDLKITLTDGIAEVVECNEAPAIVLSELEAVHQLFSAVSGIDGGLDSLPAFAREWFPLPLFVPSADGS